VLEHALSIFILRRRKCILRGHIPRLLSLLVAHLAVSKLPLLAFFIFLSLRSLIRECSNGKDPLLGVEIPAVDLAVLATR